jgi:uncharacterized lipoprotein NlpE involved in copper resistance
MKLLVILFFIAGLGNCSQTRADSLINIDQIGTNNTVVVNQDGTTQTVKLTVGKDSAVDNSYFNITQQGTGNKTATVDMPSGYNNSVIMFQDGAGNHTAAIQNLSGAANNMNFSQTGAGTHTLVVTGGVGTTNNANTVTSEQSGGAGADKTFQLNLNGTNGATVNVQQTNPTTSNSGSMSIQCITCGTYNYIRQ